MYIYNIKLSIEEMSKVLEDQIIPIIKKHVPKINLSHQQFEQIVLYFRALCEQNKIMNLTGIKDDYLILLKNIIDILFIFELNIPFQGKAIDVGSGAGLPSIILSIIYPNLQFDSIDTKEKKILFQTMISKKINLHNFTAHQIQISEWQSNQYDYFMCRAFKDMKIIFSFAKNLLKKDGKLIIWKGQNWHTEWESIPKILQSNFKLLDNHRYEIEDGLYGGHLLCIQKVK